MNREPKIAIVGADRTPAEREAIDIFHAVSFHAPVSIAAGELANAAGAAVTVIGAGAAQRPGENRPALLRRNIDVLQGIVPKVVRGISYGLILVATNQDTAGLRVTNRQHDAVKPPLGTWLIFLPRLSTVWRSRDWFLGNFRWGDSSSHCRLVTERFEVRLELFAHGHIKNHAFRRNR